MTRIQAQHLWRRDILSVFSETEKHDRALLFEAWTAFTDHLVATGRITPRQYREWMPPRECAPRNR